MASRGGRPRGMRLLAVAGGLLVMAVLGALSVMGIVALFNQGHPLRAAFLAMAPLLLLLLGAQVLNWQAGALQAPLPGHFRGWE